MGLLLASFDVTAANWRESSLLLVLVPGMQADAIVTSRMTPGRPDQALPTEQIDDRALLQAKV